MPKRLTRRESQANTRSSLMQAAARVFCKRGLQQASIDEVAEEAGFTKGAFYANFKSKEELFLAMLDERFSERIVEIERAIDSSPEIEAQARRAADDFARHVGADPEWQRLFFEFAAHAARNEEFRQELVTRYRSMRDRITELYRRAVTDAGAEPPLPLDQVALICCAMADGFALEKLLDSEAVPDDLYATMMTVFFAGLGALAQEQQPAAS
jgi:AcrR family transcriptional regulator